MNTQARQITCELEKTIRATPQDIFPLLCPVLEEKWIPGWEYRLLHSKSGVNEKGCIFRENISGTHYFEEPLTATWVTIRHDPAANQIAFLIYYGERAVARTRVGILSGHDGLSRVRWHKVLTLVDPATDRFGDADLTQKVMESLTFIADSLAGYFESREG